VSSLKLTGALRSALDEVERYTRRGWLYWYRRASMEKLAALGLVETWTPPSMINSRGKLRPYRITDLGRQALNPNSGGERE